VKVTYKPFGRATVSAEMWVLLNQCRRLGWKGTTNGLRAGARSYAMQKALWLLYRSGKGAPAFNPDLPDPKHKRRHMRANVEALGGWSNAVDVSDAPGLIKAAARLGVTLHRPYNPPEHWHVEALHPFRVGGGHVIVDQAKLVRVLRAHGVVNPVWTIQAAKKAKLPLAYACALLEKETGKGHNVFGHDPTIFAGAGIVTKAKFLAYRAKRRASGNKLMQGAGPCQLTWWATQDAADRLGGCWLPLANMTVGFTALAALIRRYGVQAGAARYNGSGPKAAAYGKDFAAKAKKWQTILS
jgi:hypothetical protein